jgi:ribokinase
VHAHLTVIGSLNADQVIKIPRLPQIGETVLGGTFALFPGGKGANQAVAAARLGAAVAMVGRVGADPIGDQLREGLAAEGIDVCHISRDPAAPTGVAFITVDAQGRNTIVVASGANMCVTTHDVEAARQAIATSQVVLLQFEIPSEVVTAAAALAQTCGCQVVLDPAPVPPEGLARELLRRITVITPNEVEAQALTGIAVHDPRSAREAAERLLALGCGAVIVKRGAAGAFVAVDEVRESIPGIPVETVDSTAAGDAFAGALGVALAEGRDLLAAAQFANAAAALSTTRMGAQPSMPRRDEVVAFAQSRGHRIG